MKHGHCETCHRSFRTASQRALSDRKRVILDDLRLSVEDNNSTLDASENRRDRHLAFSAEYRQTGEAEH